MPLRRFGFYCGIISPILWLALIATAGALRPDFSHVTNYISELAERGSATEALMRYGAFGVTGFLYVGFAAAVLATFRVGWLQRTAALLIAVEGIGRMGAGLFPCDPRLRTHIAGSEFPHTVRHNRLLFGNLGGVSLGSARA